MLACVTVGVGVCAGGLAVVHVVDAMYSQQPQHTQLQNTSTHLSCVHMCCACLFTRPLRFDARDDGIWPKRTVFDAVCSAGQTYRPPQKKFSPTISPPSLPPKCLFPKRSSRREDPSMQTMESQPPPYQSRPGLWRSTWTAKTKFSPRALEAGLLDRIFLKMCCSGLAGGRALSTPPPPGSDFGMGSAIAHPGVEGLKSFFFFRRKSAPLGPGGVFMAGSLQNPG